MPDDLPATRIIGKILILFTSSLLVLVQYLNSGVFSVEAKLWCPGILTAFPDYGAGKRLCWRLIINCVGVPDYGARNIPGCKFPHRKRTCGLPWTMGLGWDRMHDAMGEHGTLGGHGASGLGFGVRPFCKLQNVPYLEW